MGDWITINKPYNNYINHDKVDELFIKAHPEFAELYKLTKDPKNYTQWRLEYSKLSDKNKGKYNTGFQKALNQSKVTDTFSSSEYNRVGVQFEIEGGARFLIGDTTISGNDDGCCSSNSIEDKTIVTRCRVVFDPEKD